MDPLSSTLILVCTRHIPPRGCGELKPDKGNFINSKKQTVVSYKGQAQDDRICLWQRQLENIDAPPAVLSGTTQEKLHFVILLHVWIGSAKGSSQTVQLKGGQESKEYQRWQGLAHFIQQVLDLYIELRQVRAWQLSNGKPYSDAP